MRCEKADDCKLLKPAHGHSDVLCLCDRLRRSGFAHLYNEKSTCTDAGVFSGEWMYVFRPTTNRAACGTVLDAG